MSRKAVGMQFTVRNLLAADKKCISCTTQRDLAKWTERTQL